MTAKRIQPILIAKKKMKHCRLTCLPNEVLFKILSKINIKTLINCQRLCKRVQNLFEFLKVSLFNKTDKVMSIACDSKRVGITILSMDNVVLFVAFFRKREHEKILAFLKGMQLFNFRIIQLAGKKDLLFDEKENKTLQLLLPLMEKTRLSCEKFQSWMGLRLKTVEKLHFKEILYTTVDVGNFYELAESNKVKSCLSIGVTVPALLSSELYSRFRDNKAATIFGNEYTSPDYPIAFIEELKNTDTARNKLRRFEMQRAVSDFRRETFIYYNQHLKGVYLLFDDVGFYHGFWLKTLTEYAVIIANKWKGYKIFEFLKTKEEILLYFLEWLDSAYRDQPIPIDSSKYFEEIEQGEGNMLGLVAGEILDTHYAEEVDIDFDD